jgi:3-hydroxyisobutyrate dehydrogenase
LIDCPVGGTVGPALGGKLFGFAVGDAGGVARANSILDQLCRRVEHVGAVGAGASMKLAINLPLLVYWQSLGEALALCKPLDLDPARLVDILSDTRGRRMFSRCAMVR